MLDATVQYLFAGLVWIVFFIVIYLRRYWIKKKLKNICQCFNIKLNWLTYLLLGLYGVFLILNVIGIIQHKVVPWIDYLILFIVMGFMGPIAEEIIFRGLFLGYFSQAFRLKRMRLILWIVGVNVLFAWIHNFANPNPKPINELINIFILGVVISVFYLKSKKNILHATLTHLLYNVIRMYFILNF